MKTTFLTIIACFLFAATATYAQPILKGNVSELGSSKKLTDVFVKDANNARNIALTDKKGNFEIATQTGHILIFAAPGYISDTLYVTDMLNKQIKLKVQGISLREVNVTGSRVSFDPHVEYASVYTKSKVYPLSPSSWFSKEATNARRLKKFFDREEKEREIDMAFSRSRVMTLTPLKDRELSDFLIMYRPTYEWVQKNAKVENALTLYINDSYKKFMALPPEKRKLDMRLDEVK
ncbi:hypothetical protein [Mucilaginibacter myungsuensis]|uniref:Carboxypeptidase-like protein n=1 Tax=Mucilaginibacter myungsuensis TaxID=649104 RepID=A0A929L5E8_9SPHI|nr:hypothetical protein [Mucilaginibacter myungsuensis]MBE9663541.1 hypothetical protein [Mucilaginibacter myungsuensis]MDN3600279.1 hypothetical protein [Mucilaginibacter myungsuensis]